MESKVVSNMHLKCKLILMLLVIVVVVVVVMMMVVDQVVMMMMNDDDAEVHTHIGRQFQSMQCNEVKHCAGSGSWIFEMFGNS